VLAPGGRVIISVPNVGHAAVRLQLLTGRFARTDSGLLDRTHLHFFDRAGFYGLLASADLRVIDEMRTVRAVTETEIPVDLASFPADAVGLATRDADAETYQYVVVAVPGDGHAAGAVQGVAGALKEKIIAIEHDYHALERWARNLESQLQRRSDNETQVAAAAAAAEAALVRYEELAAAATAAGEAAVVRYEQLARDYEELAKGLLRLQEAHAGSVTALERSRVEVRCLQQDLEVKEAYLASLRDGDDARRQAAAHELSETRRLLGEAEAEIAVRDHNARLLEERLSQIESQAATGILARDENVRILQDRLSRTEAHALASARAAAELREETRGYQATLNLPRYRVADAMNRVFRLTGPIHRFAKQFVTRRGNGA
jgi:chromosome segregation ATPase